MPGTGAKLVSLDGDNKTHLLAAGERTECGLPIPIGGGATWTYGDREGGDVKICGDCQKAADKGAPAEPVPFDEGVEMPFAAPEPAPVSTKEAKATGGKAKTEA